MPDQAAGLRSLFARRRPSLLIVAGADPGRAAVTVHFARESAAAGRATVLIDGTSGQLAAACGIGCRYELASVLAGDVAIADVLRPLTPHLLLLPAARALSRFDALSPDESARLADAFSAGITTALRGAGDEPTQVDLIVVHADDAGRAVDAFGRDARIVVVASARPSALRAAYADIKRLAQQGIENFEIVQPAGDAAARTDVVFANLASAARRFLDIDVTDGGFVDIGGPSRLPLSNDAPFLSIAGASSDTPGASPSSNAEVSYAAVA